MKNLYFIPLAVFATASFADEPVSSFMLKSIEPALHMNDYQLSTVKGEVGELTYYRSPLVIQGLAEPDDTSAGFMYRVATPDELVGMGAPETSIVACSQVSTEYPDNVLHNSAYDTFIRHLGNSVTQERVSQFEQYRQCEMTVYFTNPVEGSEKFEPEAAYEGMFVLLGDYFDREYMVEDIQKDSWLHNCILGESNGGLRNVTFEVRGNHSAHFSIMMPVDEAQSPLRNENFVKELSLDV